MGVCACVSVCGIERDRVRVRGCARAGVRICAPLHAEGVLELGLFPKRLFVRGCECAALPVQKRLHY